MSANTDGGLTTQGWTYQQPDSAPPTPIRADMPPEYLSADEQAFNLRVVQEQRKAQAAVMASAIVVDTWWQFLRDKYGLDEADTIDEQGRIARKASQDASYASLRGETSESE